MTFACLKIQTKKKKNSVKINEILFLLSCMPLLPRQLQYKKYDFAVTDNCWKKQCQLR